MTKLTKFILGVAVTGLASGLLIVTGVINVGDTVGWYLTLPAGAVFSGLFMICLMLEKESARFDAEHRAHPAAKPGDRSAKPSAAETHCGCHAEPQRAH